MLAFTIAHLSIVRAALHASPTATGRTACRCRSRVRGGELPLPAVLGALASAAGWRRGDGRARAGPLRRPRLDARSGSRCTWSTAAPTKRRCCKRVTVSPEVLRAEPPARARLRLGARAAVRHRARRRHRADGGAARVRRADRRGGDRRGDDRGAVDLRDPDVAAARREPARRADQARAAGARARQGGRRGVHRRARSRPRSCARAAPATRSSTRRAGAASRRSCSAPRNRRRSAAARGSGGRGGPLEGYVGDITKYVVAQGAVPRDRDRARRRATRRSRRRSRGAGEPRAAPAPSEAICRRYASPSQGCACSS